MAETRCGQAERLASLAHPDFEEDDLESEW